MKNPERKKLAKHLTRRDPRGWKIRDRPGYFYGRIYLVVVRAELATLVESATAPGKGVSKTELINKAIEQYFSARDVLK